MNALRAILAAVAMIAVLSAPAAAGSPLAEAKRLLDAAVEASQEEKSEFQGYVVRIADGDTVTVIDSSKTQHRIRLYGIDAPESSQAWGQRSKQSLADMVFNRNIRIDVADKDRYGRLVGRLYVDGIYVNAEQVRRGMAWEYDRYNRDAIITRYEREAREAKVGLWSDPHAQPPWEYRRNN